MTNGTLIARQSIKSNMNVDLRLKNAQPTTEKTEVQLGIFSSMWTSVIDNLTSNLRLIIGLITLQIS